jgi:carbon-monoxide dehydrogenase iron sulfur subunit
MERCYVLCDTDKCTGCRMCEFACSSARDGTFALELSMIRVMQPSPANVAAVACRFCKNAPCVAACPRGALTTDSDSSTIKLDKARCAGCGWCVESCPFGAIVLDWSTKTVAMCDLCLGLPQPKCIEFCPKGALRLYTFKRGEATPDAKKSG